MPEMTKTLYLVIYILFKHASVWGREKTNAELRQVIPSIVIALAGRCACLWRHAFLQLLFLHLQENRAHCLFDEACSYLKKTSTVWSNWENMSARTKIHQCSVCFEIMGFLSLVSYHAAHAVFSPHHPIRNVYFCVAVRVQLGCGTNVIYCTIKVMAGKDAEISITSNDRC